MGASVVRDRGRRRPGGGPRTPSYHVGRPHSNDFRAIHFFHPGLRNANIPNSLLPGNLSSLMGLSRSDVLPDLKTAAEQGYDLNCASLSAFEFPKGTPEPIAARLAEATNKAVALASVRERFETLGVSVEPPERRTRAYYAKSLPPEVERQATVMKASGLTTE